VSRLTAAQADVRTKVEEIEDKLESQVREFQRKIERRDKKAREEKKAFEDQARKQIGAFLEVAIEKVETTKNANVEQGLRDLAQSVKEGKSIAHYRIGNTFPTPPPSDTFVPFGGVRGDPPPPPPSCSSSGWSSSDSDCSFFRRKMGRSEKEEKEKGQALKGDHCGGKA
jgi:hypothetical protein